LSNAAADGKRRRALDGLVTEKCRSDRPEQVLVLTRFLHANRHPLRIKSGASFRSKTLYVRGAAAVF
jgi:hypothetical protein